jgi:hypothetical protein
MTTVCNICSIYCIIFIYIRVHGGMVEQGQKVEERKRSGSLRNKVRNWSCLSHVLLFNVIFILFAVFECV